MTNPGAPEPAQALTNSEQYKNLEKAFYNAGWMIRMNPMSKNSFYHDVLAPRRDMNTLEPLKGITFPKTFEPLRYATIDDYEHAPEIPDGFGTELIDPTGAYKPNASSTFLDFTKFMMASHSARQRQLVRETWELGIDAFPKDESFAETVAFVPPTRWFDPKITEIEERDILTIFPQAERELLCLLIGRIVVGRSGNWQPGLQKAIQHTCRMLGIILGIDAGLGKSYTCNQLINALKYAGYHVEAISKFGRFGIGSVANSHLAYKDDITAPELDRLLKEGAGLLKSVVTNELIKCEEKFIAEHMTYSHTAMLLNTNAFSPNLLYGLDEGIVSRMKILSTIRQYELNNFDSNPSSRDVSSASEGSPTLSPPTHIPWLCKKYDIEPITLFLWLCRLCADKFYALIESGDPNPLRLRVEHLTKHLQVSFDDNASEAFLELLAFCHILANCEKTEYTVPEMNPRYLTEALQYAVTFCVHKDLNPMRAKLKQLWEDQGRPERHPYFAIRRLQLPSLVDAYKQACSQIKDVSLEDYLKAVFSRLITRSGFKFGASPVYLIADWQSMRDKQETLRYLVTQFEECREIAGMQTDTGWLLSPQYSPDTAEKLIEKSAHS